MAARDCALYSPSERAGNFVQPARPFSTVGFLFVASALSAQVVSVVLPLMALTHFSSLLLDDWMTSPTPGGNAVWL